MSNEEAIAQEQQLVELGMKLVEAAKAQNLSLRLLGAIAFRVHCPTHKHLEYAVGRWLTDVDLACGVKDLDKIIKLFQSQGFVENERVRLIHGNERLIFDHPNGAHCDVFVDRLHFCHDVWFKGRYDADYPSIPLAELLLEKLQIVGFEAKDAVDSFVLLREHPLGDGDKETVNVGLIAKICADDWGFWKTINLNLDKIDEFARKGDLPVADEDRNDVLAKTAALRKRLDEVPKSFKWQMRAKVGTRVPWYRSVDELTRD